MLTQKAESNTQATLLFRYELFINFWLRLFDTRRETQFLKVFRLIICKQHPQSFAYLVIQSHFLNSWSDSNFSTSLPDPTSHHHGRTPTSTACHWGWQPNCLPTVSTVNSQLQLSDSMTDNPTVCLLCPQSTPNFNCLTQWQTTQLSAYSVHSQLPTSTVWLNGRQPNCLPAVSTVNSQLQLSDSMAENPAVCLHGPKSTPNWRDF